jgi:hypothetical protein
MIVFDFPFLVYVCYYFIISFIYFQIYFLIYLLTHPPPTGTQILWETIARSNGT